MNRIIQTFIFILLRSHSFWKREFTTNKIKFIFFLLQKKTFSDLPSFTDHPKKILSKQIGEDGDDAQKNFTRIVDQDEGQNDEEGFLLNVFAKSSKIPY